MRVDVILPADSQAATRSRHSSMTPLRRDDLAHLFESWPSAWNRIAFEYCAASVVVFPLSFLSLSRLVS